MKSKHYKMQEALDVLRQEYPDINASTLRFWEKEGLIKPSGETSGGHRRYSEQDLDIIRFIKDLSGFGYSLGQIRQELFSIREKIEFEKTQKISSELYSTTYVAKLLMHHRTRKKLNMKLQVYYDMDESIRYIPTFKRNILEKRLEYNCPKYLINNVYKLKLTRPKEIDGKLFYSPCDEIILEVLILILEEEKDFLKRCKDLASAIHYLYKKIGLITRFPIRSWTSLDLSMYKALLYNLIQERLSYEKMEKGLKK